ncbi:helix-turn-helix domain-containing protein [Egicoccus sp. AB-alg2]|uniref:helix-turn-helix domain-containing protein n=1 Tax=Egicoccus sp. AB-alg2 TaxID=3242693 RepID=UPI00359CD15B
MARRSEEQPATEIAAASEAHGGAAVSDGPEIQAVMSGVGRQIRSLRKVHGLTLEELANRSGVSVGLLSQVERGIGNPAFNSLARIAHALNTPIAALLHTGPDQSPVVRRHERRRLDVHAAGTTGIEAIHELLTPSLNQQLEVIEIQAPPGYSTENEPFSHAGEEFGMVIEGRHEVNVGGQSYVLEAGDSISYLSSIPHWYRNPGPEPVRAIWVITPPTF